MLHFIKFPRLQKYSEIRKLCSVLPNFISLLPNIVTSFWVHIKFVLSAILNTVFLTKIATVYSSTLEFIFLLILCTWTSISQSTPTLSPLVNVYSFFLWFLLFPWHYVIVICVWIISISLVYARFIYILSNHKIPLSLKADLYFIMYICYTVFSHSLINT